MKTEKSIFVAFILNFAFSVFEFIGGIYIGSVAVTSDALHDAGDAVGIGISYFLEKKSKNKPDEKYTYGYTRYSVVGSVIVTAMLLIGSILVIYRAVSRIISPSRIKYNEMIALAVVGVLVNFFAAYFTREERDLNQKAVKLHMLEDVLGWAVVLLGAVTMRFTDFIIIDPIMSIGVAVFIIFNAVRNLKEILELFLLKTPRGINVKEIKKHVAKIDGVLDVHHIHVWSMDGQSNYATMHIVAKSDYYVIKEKVRKELKKQGICHLTLELEAEGELCKEKHCRVEDNDTPLVHHHHSH